MQFKFGGKSGLAGREVRSTLARAYYVPESDNGMEEFILVSPYERVLGPRQEPDLYRDARIEDVTPKERHLTYPDVPGTEVILTTPQEDDKFRAENPDIISRNVLFELDE